MTTNSREDHPPDEQASYGAMLGYWMNVMGISDGALARGVGIDRSYTGHIRRGRKLPSPEIADLLREHLLAKAEQPGWNGPHLLTVSDRQRMDALLRASFTRAHAARKPTQPLSEPVTTQQIREEPVIAMGAQQPDPRVDSVGLPAPLLPGARELEALITLKGDDPSADELVRARVNGVHLLALGQVDLWGLAHLLHCTVPVGTTVIPMLPVFTRMEHLMAAVLLNTPWRELQAIEVEGSVLLGDLDSEEYLGINPWSGQEFKLPAFEEEPTFDTSARREGVADPAAAPSNSVRDEVVYGRPAAAVSQDQGVPSSPNVKSCVIGCLMLLVVVALVVGAIFYLRTRPVPHPSYTAPHRVAAISRPVVAAPKASDLGGLFGDRTVAADSTHQRLTVRVPGVGTAWRRAPDSAP